MMDSLSASTAANTAVGGHAAPTASWAAIFAGAVATVGLTLVLFALGSGLGLASVSPWSDRGASAAGFTVAAAIWLIVIQWATAALGGYLAGRLRHRWHGTHTHEVFFRDTAHGLVTWAVATLALIGIAAGSASSLLGGATHAAATAVSGVAQGAMTAATAAASGAGSGTSPYDIDKLFRAPATNASASSPTNGAAGDARAEAAHLAAAAVTSGTVSDDDKTYLTALIAGQTGISQQEAQQRVQAFIAGVTDAQAKAKAVADDARKAAAKVAIYAALSMLIGAFVASVAAAIGGSQRDEHV